MSISRQRRPSMKMEMTPLIDVVFLLLIFFMLSSSFLSPTIELTLPTARADNSSEPQAIIVTLDDQGDVYVNRNEVKLDQLTARLAELLPSSKDKTVTIRADKNMKFDYFVRALDAAKASGAVQVNIAHQVDER